MQAMLGIVCRSYEGVKALEKYDEQGNIKNDASSLHGVGLASGKKISGRFLVMCLEDLRQLNSPRFFFVSFSNLCFHFIFFCISVGLQTIRG